MDEAHLPAYLDEFVFRFNRRHSENRGLLFWRLVCALADSGPVTLVELGQRRAAMSAADQVHAERLKDWTLQTTRERAARQAQEKAEAAGRVIKPRRVQPAGEPPRQADGQVRRRKAG